MRFGKAYLTEEFETKRGKYRIAGTRFAPKKGGSGVPVIISHGFMGNRKTVEEYAVMMTEMGYTAYTFDFVGGGPKIDSGGDMTEMSVLTECADLFSVMEYVKKRHAQSAGKLVLMGCSQGGFVSAMLAAKRKEEVGKLILFYPALCIPDDANRGQMLLFRFDPANVPDVIPAMGGKLQIGRKYVEDAMSLDPYEAIRGYRGDVLIVHGTADRVVDYAYSEKAEAAYGGNAQLFAIRNAGHGFRREEDAVAKETVRQFLAGRREVLTVDVRTSKPVLERKGLNSTLTIPFDGFAKGPFFEGVIQAGAQDVQKRKGMRPVEFCAQYSLRGVDVRGQSCTVEIVNRTADGTHWIPEVRTDSEELGFLNGAYCEAVLENRKTGPVVHIFTGLPEGRAIPVR